MLDGLAVAAVAMLAGGDVEIAVRLGLAMVALQASIGALNDVIDAPLDAGRKIGKPIPLGLVSTIEARRLVVAAAVVGIGLTVPSGAATVSLSIAVLAIGYGYDRFARGTPWSWLPFALGIPLLPVFGWLGAAGALPAHFAILLPAAVAAGAGLAIANALADLERDVAAGSDSIAVRLGRERAWRTHAYLLWGVLGVAFASLIAVNASSFAVGAATIAGVIVAVGANLGREGGPERRERAWEIEAVGVAILAMAWLAGMTAGAGAS